METPRHDCDRADHRVAVRSAPGGPRAQAGRTGYHVVSSPGSCTWPGVPVSRHSEALAAPRRMLGELATNTNLDSRGSTVLMDGCLVGTSCVELRKDPLEDHKGKVSIDT